jgi:DNA-binding LytR/AlgR family response regulator
MKPVTQERFMKAVSKFHFYAKGRKEKEPVPDAFEQAYIFLKIGKDQTKIFLKDIIYVEGLKDYIKVHTPGKVFIAYDRLSYMEEKLPENKFARIHKSYIVALDKITNYNAEQVRLNEKALAIGRVYKNEFMKRFLRN